MMPDSSVLASATVNRPPPLRVTVMVPPLLVMVTVRLVPPTVAVPDPLAFSA